MTTDQKVIKTKVGLLEIPPCPRWFSVSSVVNLSVVLFWLKSLCLLAWIHRLFHWIHFDAPSA